MPISQKVPVNVQNVSGEYLGHRNTFTSKCGTLTPALVQPVIPQTRIRLSVGSQIQLPPMATDFYGNIRMCFEAFFVPYRIIYGDWKNLITRSYPGATSPGSGSNSIPGGVSSQSFMTLPQLKISNQFLGPGSLADYLGYKLGPDYLYDESNPESKKDYVIRNFLPFAAYHKIWEDWYRDSRTQTGAFLGSNMIGFSESINPPLFAYMPLPSASIYNNVQVTKDVVYSGTNLQCLDGVAAYSLRQRNWARDYFTSSTLKPQQGDPVSVVIQGTQGNQTFSMQQLFAANALQRWKQINNVAGERYSDQILAHFGTLPPDAVMDRPVFLGRAMSSVYTKGVYQSNPGSASIGAGSNNPFDSVGAKYGASMGVLPIENGTLIEDFTAKEHGFVFVMASLVPDCLYSTGIRRYLQAQDLSDFPFASLSTMGDEVIRRSELSGEPWDGETDDYTDTFAYNERYASYKSHPDEVHGLLRDGQSLESFCLQRSFPQPINLQFGSQFLQIPTDYLDQVTAVTSDASKFGYWCDNYFDFKVSQPLPAWCEPTLSEPSGSHVVEIPNGGRML